MRGIVLVDDCLIFDWFFEIVSLSLIGAMTSSRIKWDFFTTSVTGSHFSGVLTPHLLRQYQAIYPKNTQNGGSISSQEFIFLKKKLPRGLVYGHPYGIANFIFYEKYFTHGISGI